MQSADSNVSTRVVMAVAETLDVDPRDVDALNEVVDPDALDRLHRTPGGTGEATVRVSFTFAGCSVAVDGDGSVEVTASADEPPRVTPAVATPATESTNLSD